MILILLFQVLNIKEAFFQYYARKSFFFVNFVMENYLSDINFTGSNFTWCNGQWPLLGAGLGWIGF